MANLFMFMVDGQYIALCATNDGWMVGRGSSQEQALNDRSDELYQGSLCEALNQATANVPGDDIEDDDLEYYKIAQYVVRSVIRNINQKFGDTDPTVTFNDVTEMLAALISCGFADASTQLREGIDYEIIHELTAR